MTYNDFSIELENFLDETMYSVNVNSYNRFFTFTNISKHLKGKVYWKVLRDSYQESDNLFKFRKKVKKAFSSKELNRESLMSNDEIEYLNNLPEKITIYRGMTCNEYDSKDFGVSWTLKKEIAEYFINTYGRNQDTNHLPKMLHEMVINKNDVIAFFNGRNEFEIIYINKKPKVQSNRNLEK